MDNEKPNSIREKGAAMRLRLFSKWQDFRERMHHKHRFVVMDTDTLQEKFSAELTGTNIFTYAGITFIVLLILASLLIAFTPLRSLVPGYINPELKEESLRNAKTIDSLEVIIDQHEQHINIIQNILNGNTTFTTEAPVATNNDGKIVYRHSKADSLLRLKIERQNEQDKPAKKKRKK